MGTGAGARGTAGGFGAVMSGDGIVTLLDERTGALGRIATIEEIAEAEPQVFRIVDADGELIPSQDLYLVTLANGYSFAARGSGTEPKMKFYMFASEQVANARELPAVKARVRATLDRLNQLIETDARARAES